MSADAYEMPGAIRHAAVAWHARLRSGTCTDEERREHAAWLERAPAHRRAFEEVERLWADLGAAAARRPASASTRRPAPASWLAGAAVLAACGVGALLLVPAPRPTEPTEQAWATGAGEQLRLDLRGGVRAVLNTGSRLVLRSGGEGRQALLEGEAYFDLDPAAHGRFEVRAGGARIRDIGTRFAVRAERDRLTVVVEEGAVGVSAAGGPERLVTAGRGLVVGGGRPPAEAGPVDVEAALAWRTGRLVFRERPLGEVLTDLARYHGVVVSIPDPVVASIAVTGRLEVASLEDALAALAVAAPVRFARPAPGRLVVERAARPGRAKSLATPAPRPAPP